MSTDPKKKSSAGTWCMLTMAAIITSIFIANMPKQNPKPASITVKFDPDKEEYVVSPRRTPDTSPHISKLANWNRMNLFGLIVDVPDFAAPKKVTAPAELRSRITGGAISEINILLNDLSMRVEHVHFLNEKPEPTRVALDGIAQMKSMQGLRIISDSVMPVTVTECEAAITSIEYNMSGKAHSLKSLHIEYRGNLWNVTVSGQKADMDYAWPKIESSIFIKKR